ncbi:MAG: HlyD family efflux transporter periplasmic adaptor subunit [Gemmatimonadales bacterium]
MDIAREPKPKGRRFLYMGGGLVALVLATVAISRLRPAAPSVERGTLWMDTVVTGAMTREVRGPGTLVPEQVRWVSAVTAGRVERKLVQPGVRVTASTILLELSNPDVQIQLLQAERQLTDAQAQVVSLKTSLETQRLTQSSLVAQIRTEYRDAIRRAAADSELAAEDLISRGDYDRSKDKATELIERLQLEQQRLTLYTENIHSQLEVQEAQVGRLRAVADFQRNLVDAMVVRAGADGVLQELPLEVGQWATSGVTLAKVVQPEKLKAVLRIPETQAKDLSLGQAASVDTRNGLAAGHVMRIDPASQNGTVTVDIALEGALPKGARPDLSVDGTIEIERLGEVISMGRPAYGQANSAVGIFRMVPGTDEAERVRVDLGRSSVNRIEVVRGLKPGDVVILSDMSRWDAVERVRVR